MFFQKFVLLLCFFHRVLPENYDYTRDVFSPDIPRNYSARIVRNVCVDQPYKHFKLLTCGVRLIRNQPSQTYVSGIFLTPQDPVLIHVKVYYRFRTFQPYLLDVWFNYCEAYNNSANAPSLGRLTLNSMKHSTPDLPGCPLEGLFNITHVVHDAQLPPFMPAGEYRVDMKYFTPQNETLLAVESYLTVRAKGAAVLAMG